MPEDPHGWFAGEKLARWLAPLLSQSKQIQVDRKVIAEDWGWCVLVRANGQRFFLGIGEDFDSDRHWRIFVAKDFDLPARLFARAKLLDSVQILCEGIAAALATRNDISNIQWFDR